MSLAGQWDAVNGEVPRYLTVQASMDHDHQLDRCLISDVKPAVELLMEQLTERPIVFACVANDARGSTEHSL